MTLDPGLLWEIQKCEDLIRGFRESLARMPLALEQARAEVQVREKELKAREAELQELVKKRRSLERDIEALEQSLRENATRQGSARSNAELNALKGEAEFIREKKSNLETKVLESFEVEEAHQGKIGAARENLDRARQEMGRREKDIEERQAGERAALTVREAESAGLTQRLPPPIRTRFEQLLRAKSGSAVVTIQRGACGGCFNALPPQFVNEVRKAERLMLCEGCGRILIWLEGAAEGGEA